MIKLAEKSTKLGVAVFLYVVAAILAAVILYNAYFALVFTNMDMGAAFAEPGAGSNAFYRVFYAFLSLFIPFFGNTQATAVLCAAIPVFIGTVIAASVLLSQHLFFKEIEHEE